MKVRFQIALVFVGSWAAISPVMSAQTAANGISSKRLDVRSAQPGSPVRPPAAYGTTEYSVTSVFAGSFNGGGVLDPIATNGLGYRYFTGGSRNFIGSVSIPSGAIIDFIGLTNCDADGGEFTFELFDSTANDYHLVGSVVSTGNACETEYNGSALGYSYSQNAGHNLEIYIFQTGAPLDGSAGVLSAEVWWRRQVRPGPSVATFTDVPTNHPFFQFVEALHAAGITGGYPDGRFGVNDAVTRGQMAVFLSTALGLNWPY